MTTDKQAEARRRALRRLLTQDGERVEVAGGELRWLLDEVSRLQQSNDRLRRQNRRLRLRGGLVDAADDAAAGDSAHATDDDGDV